MNPNGPFYGQQLWMMIDGYGNAVAGMAVWRKKKPANGRWKLITSPNLCCNPIPGSVSLDATVADLTNDSYTITIICDATDILEATFTLTAATTTLAEIVSALNTYYSSFGHFTSLGDDGVHLELFPSIAADLCADGTLTMTVVAV
jgi:hypothetical protein